jgi:hypothetical protein
MHGPQQGTPPPAGAGDLGIDWLEIAGHSLAAGGGARISPLGGYALRLMRALGIPRVHDYSIGGAIACRPNANATGDGGYPWILRNVLRPGSASGATLLTPSAAGAPYNPQSQLALVHFALNDLGLLGAAKPLPFQTGLRTVLARFCSSSVFPVEPSGGSSAQWAETGTWADQVISDAAASSDGGGFRASSTVGDKKTFTIPADMPVGRVVGIGLWMNAGLGAQTYGVRVLRGGNPLAGVANIVVTATQVTDQSLANQHIVHTVRFGTGIVGNANDPMGGQTLQPGDKIELTLNGGTLLAPDFAHIEADPLDGPILLCPLPNRPANYSIWSSWSGGASMNDGVVDQWKDYERAILAEFPGRVISDSHGLGVDLDDANLVKTTDGTGDFFSDGAHPNDRGHGKWVELLAPIVRGSPLITDRIRARPYVDPRPRGWKKVGVVNGAGAFAAGWSNVSAAGLNDLQWRTNEHGRCFVRGSIKAAVGFTTTVVGANVLPKPLNLAGGKPGFQFDGASWNPRNMRVGTNGSLTTTGNVAVSTAAGNQLEFDFDYQTQS